jgi:hypothetical protein
MSPALAHALRQANELQRRKPRVRPIVLPPPEVLRKGLSRRPAEQVPVTLRPISVLRPLAETDEQLRAGVIEIFREANRLGRCG